MCSNSGSSSGGGTDGVDGNGGGLSPNSKKPQKRQRLPKRGPGVAELEKILREQENKNDHHVIEGFNPSCFAPLPPLLSSNINNDPFHNFPQTLNSRPPQPLPPPPIPMTPTRRSVNLGQQFPDQIAPVAPNIYANGYASFLQRPNIGGSGVALLDQKAFFPVTWTSTTPSMSNNIIGNADDGKYSDSTCVISSLPKPFSNESNPLWSSPSLMQDKHPQNPNSMFQVNQFRGSASSSSAPSSAGLYHPIEPPSSQRSHHSYPSMGQEEEKACAIGMKRRSQSFPMDNPRGPIFHHQVPQLPPHMHRPADQLSSYNLDLSKTMRPTRDTKLDNSLELNMHNRYTTQYGAPNASSVKFVPQTVVSPPLHDTFQGHHVSKFDMLPFQGSMEYSNRRSEPAGSDCNKPFYKFLLSKEQMGTKVIDCESEPGEEGIDLNLKL